MRPNTLKAGLAAAIVSLSFANAFAANTTNAVGESPRAAPPITEQEPRLEAVLGQLQSQVDGIKMEQTDRNISKAESAKLDRQVADIRKDAEHVASKNGGRIPAGDYHALLARMDNLVGPSNTELQDPN